MLNPVAAFLFALSAPAPADIREINHLAFEICPKVLDRSFELDNPAFLAETALTLMDKNDTSTIVTRGEGPTLTRIIEMHEPNEPKSCGVIFVDSEDHAGFEALTRTLLGQGFQRVPSDGYPENALRVFRKSDDPRRAIAIMTAKHDPKIGPGVVVQLIDMP